MNSQHLSLLQGLPQQQSGFSAMQQLQQQLMFRKMQELQRQKELRQLNARLPSSVNQMPSFTRQASGGHAPTLINGNPIPDASCAWGELTVGSSNWLQCGSPAIQGTSSGLVFPPEQASMEFGHQQADQYLYGIPVSSSGSNLNQYSHLATDKTSIQQMATYGNTFPGNQYAVFSEQVTMQDGTLVSQQGSQGKSLLTHSPGQSSNSGINVDHLQQLNSLQRNASGQESQGPQDLSVSSEILQDKTVVAAASTHGAASLDPTEEKILFGSDDNIWDAFGGNTDLNGGASNLLDGNGFLNGVPSAKSGSWSALMQSAVAETSSSDIGLQDELAGLSFQNPVVVTGVHQHSVYDWSEKPQIALSDDNLQTASAVSFGSVHSDGANINNSYRSVIEFQQYGQNNLYEYGEGLQINSSKRLNSLSSGGSKWFSGGAVQNPHAEGGQIYDNASRTLDVVMDGTRSSAHWTSQQCRSSQLDSAPSNWNSIESVPPHGDTEQYLNKIEHSKLLGHVPKSSDAGKGHILDQRGEGKGYDEVCSREVFPGYVHNMFPAMDNSAGLSANQSSLTSSQNMLELLHKVDQSREHASASADAETSDGAVGCLQRIQSCNSQGFGLQLAPPLQWFSLPNHASPSAGSTVYSNSSTQASSDIRDMRQPELASPYSVRSLPPSQETFPGEFKNEKAGNLGQTGSEASGHKIPGNISSTLDSGFPNPRSQPQNLSVIGERGGVLMSHSDKSSFDGHTPDVRRTDEWCGRVLTGQSAEGSLPDTAGCGQYDNDVSFDITRNIFTRNPRERVQPAQPLVGEKFPVSQNGPNFGVSQPGASSKTGTNLWTNARAQQLSLRTQAHKFHGNHSQPHQLDIVESTSSGGQNLENQDMAKRGNFPSDLGANSVNPQGFIYVENQATKGSPSQVSLGNTDPVHMLNEPQGKESLIRNMPDASPMNPTSSQRDLEAFGRFLKPNNFHQSYSLLNQIQAMKNSDSDSSHRGTKRLKSPDSFLDGEEGARRSGHLNKQNAVVVDVTAQRTMLPSADSEMLSFAGPADNFEKGTSAQLGNVLSKDMLAFCPNESQNYALGNTIAFIKGEHSQISPLTAPSWFNQYGIFKNGQILPIYDMRKAATVKPLEQPSDLGIPFSSLEKEVENAAADKGQVGGKFLQNSVLPSVAIEHFSSPLPVNVGSQNFVVLRPKKRKSSHPWHKEVSQGSRHLYTFSMAADEWAKSANRLTEKVEAVGEMVNDISPVTRPRKRLIFTTQSMQQLLRPPPAKILSADGTAYYESVTYLVARLALGDACNLVCSAQNCSDVPPGGSDSGKASEKIDDQQLSEIIKDLLGRARKLEKDFSRLEKRPSVLELRVECQDLEKFSVINRFARLYVRGQAGGAESSSSDASSQKFYPQRYVAAVPLPKNLPDRVQCISL